MVDADEYWIGSQREGILSAGQSCRFESCPVHTGEEPELKPKHKTIMGNETERAMSAPEFAEFLRSDIKVIEKQARSLMTWHGMVTPPTAEKMYHHEGEMKAHILLAVRHLEDARMRLGKVIQYSGDGESCYDK